MHFILQPPLYDAINRCKPIYFLKRNAIPVYVDSPGSFGIQSGKRLLSRLFLSRHNMRSFARTLAGRREKLLLSYGLSVTRPQFTLNGE